MRKAVVLRQQRWISLTALLLIVALAIALRFYRLGADGLGNLYYAATVRSMLDSWHNFFFAAFEPGGSITVDKPPLGFWVQTASAAVLGVNGLALALPQALAGVLAVPLLYHLVQRRFGVVAGLLAALALATTPISVATDRNNTIDALLLPLLLVAAWAVLRAAESGRLRYLLLCAFATGLAFNVKMLQAFLPLPAFYLLYLVAARRPLRQRLVHLSLASGLLLAVSLSWAIAVDLTPPDQRPFIGSSTNNTVMDLIIGHNGLRRLLPDWPSSPPSQPLVRPAGPSPDAPTAPGGLPPPPPPGRRQPFQWEIGEPGPLRLFREPLAAQISWLMPLAAVGLLVAALHSRRSPERWQRYPSLVLWGMWLVTTVVFFSVANLFHRHYLEMLAPPLAALFGIGSVALWRAYRRPGPEGWALPLALVTTAVLQVTILRAYTAQAAWLTGPIVAITAVVAATLVVARAWLLSGRAGLLAGRLPAWHCLRLLVAAAVLALLAAPVTWAVLTVTEGGAGNAALPAAGPRPQPPAAAPPGPRRPPPPNASTERLLAYLEPRTADSRYLLATHRANEAAPFILATNRPVLTFGGFTGSDRAVTVDQLAELVATGQLRYVLVAPARMQGPQRDLMNWIRGNCRPVPLYEWAGVRPGAPIRPDRPILYRCGQEQASPASSTAIAGQ